MSGQNRLHRQVNEDVDQFIGNNEQIILKWKHQNNVQVADRDMSKETMALKFIRYDLILGVARKVMQETWKFSIDR